MYIKLFLFVFTIVLSVSPLARAQMNTEEGDWVFNVADEEVLRIKTTGEVEVSGSIKLPDHSAIATCSPSGAGTFRYHTVNKTAQFCDGTTFKTIEFVPPAIGYFVLSNSTWNGDLGGYAGANAKCLTELQNETWLGKADATINASTVRAFLSSGSGVNADITAHAEYRFAVANQPGVGGFSFTTDALGVGPNDNADWSNGTRFGGNYSYWSDLSSNGTTQWAFDDLFTVGDCDGFTNSGFASGGTGRSNETGAGRYHYTGSSTICPGAQRLICVVNP